jgi:hypothetical protein
MAWLSLYIGGVNAPPVSLPALSGLKLENTLEMPLFGLRKSEV